MRAPSFFATRVRRKPGHVVPNQHISNRAAGPNLRQDSEFVGEDTPDYIDALTVIMHELGHHLGHDHDHEGLMDDVLDVGIRHRPQ